MNTAEILGAISSGFTILLGFGALVRFAWKAANAFERVGDEVKAQGLKIQALTDRVTSIERRRNVR